MLLFTNYSSRIVPAPSGSSEGIFRKEMMSTHMRFIVQAPRESSDPTRQINHASETIGRIGAYFVRYTNEVPVQHDDGTFEVHAPSWRTLDTLRQMLTVHEGLTIVREEEVPGNGFITSQIPQP